MKISLNLNTENKEKVTEIAQAVATLVEILTFEELTTLAGTIRKKPQIVQKIRPLLEKDKLSLTETLAIAKDFYTYFKK